MATFCRLGYTNASDKATIFDVKATIHGIRAEYDHEIACLLSAQKIYQKNFAEHHRSTIECAFKLATAYRNNGELAEAVKVLTHYQKVAAEMLGSDAAWSIKIQNLLNQLTSITADE